MKVVVVAGRRVDAPGAEQPRFPLKNVANVSARLADVLEDLRPDTVMASGAAGADLLALQAAQRLGAHTIVVLPFDADRFEKSSVADRPGDWPKLYREVLAASDVEFVPASFDDDAYAAVTGQLLARAVSLGGVDGTTAVVVWEGASRGASDQTARFLERARALGLRVTEVSTRE